MNRKPKLERRELSDLLDFPLQEVYAGTTTKTDDDDLKVSIGKDGLKDPVEVLPANEAGLPPDTILDGHRRRDALVACGESSVPVLVRHDLATADRATIDRLFLEANSVRRQLDPLAKAFIAAKLVEIERDRPLDDLLATAWEADEVRERVGKAIGISGRHLSRLLNVIRTPIEVQVAVRKKKLSIVSAEKVAGLPQSVQDEIAVRIRVGDAPKSVVESVVGTAAGKPKCVETSFRRYLTALSKSVEHLGDGLKQIRFSPEPDEIAVLERASRLNEALVKRLRTNERRNAGKRNLALKAISEEVADG